MDPSTRDLVFQAIRDLEFVPPPEQPSECAKCTSKNPSLRCLYCFDAQFLCTHCMVEQHAENPLHRIEMLTLSGLAGVTLKNAGLRIQLGHRLYDPCPTPIADNNFVILDADGLHEVALDYCGCTNPVRSRGKQLRDAHFFPEGDTNPHTAVAFKLAYGTAVPASMAMRVYHALQIVSLRCAPHGPHAHGPSGTTFPETRIVEPRCMLVINCMYPISAPSDASRYLMEDLDPARTRSPSPDEYSYLGKAKPKVKLHAFVPRVPPDDDDPVSQPYVQRYYSADIIEHRVYNDWFLSQSNEWETRWNADFEAAFEAYKESEIARAKEATSESSDQSMLSDLTDEDDEPEIREPGVIYMANPYPAGSADAVRFAEEWNRISNECWHRNGTSAGGTRKDYLDDNESPWRKVEVTPADRDSTLDSSEEID
ncbi:hypothetical protein B0H11DRAFT_2225313 [Mycena galericulata]|nr:hypothetical protein B0H11DRAFT_2225313 [Mycena galericulata]